MTNIHLSADSDVWTGDSTRALIAARSCPDSVVICGISDAGLLRRFEPMRVIPCRVDSIFGALNLSRVLRRIPGSRFQLHLHSPAVLSKVTSALELVGRAEPIELIQTPVVDFPSVEVRHPAENAAPLLMWLGNITPTSGLAELIDFLGTQTHRQWRLRVVGQGKAKVVSPILKKCRKLEIHNRIEWVGYSANPYEQMNDVSIGIALNSPTVAREFAAASIPTVTSLSDLSL